MPELPEVETVRRKLGPKIINKTIVSAKVLWANTVVDIAVSDFEEKLKNQTIVDIRRRGKWLVFELTSYYLLVHLRMEGKFSLKNATEERSKHEHVIFTLNDIELRFHDTRKFGKMYLLNKDELMTRKPLNELGLEPFDEHLTVTYLRDKYHSKSLPIKTVLLDQKIMVGLGNIYANEVLFASRVNPYLSANKLNDRELQDIIDNTRNILKKAIELGGSTIRSYVSLDNEKGSFQNELLVHGRDGQVCGVCGTTIVKKFINGRGTFYCPTCQNVKK